MTCKAFSIDCSLSLYADDSTLFFSGTCASVIATRLSLELSKCQKWLVENKLSLHLGKTECLLFGSRGKLKRADEFTIHCEGKAIQRVTHVKYLGAQLDANLNGSIHVSGVLKTCMARLSFLYRNSNLLDSNLRKMLCMSLIQPYMDYCASSWYSSINSALRLKLDVLQRKMVRFIYNFEFTKHVGYSELKSLSWLSVPDRVKFFKLVHVFRIKHGLAPSYLTTHFTSVSDTHSYHTRGSVSNFHVSKSVAIAPTTFAVTGIRHWNELPGHLKLIDSLKVFKRKLRAYLLDGYD